MSRPSTVNHVQGLAGACPGLRSSGVSVSSCVTGLSEAKCPRETSARPCTSSNTSHVGGLSETRAGVSRPSSSNHVQGLSEACPGLRSSGVSGPSHVVGLSKAPRGDTPLGAPPSCSNPRGPHRGRC